MRLTGVLALLSCLVASGCGAASTQRAADESEPVSAPPIEAIDEPADTSFVEPWATRADDSYVHTFWCADESSTESDEECEESPESVEKLRRMEEEFKLAVKPAAGFEPRKIARLPLTTRGPKSHAFLIAWRNRAAELCLADSHEDEEGGGGGGPIGPCVPGDKCVICLTYSGSLTENEWLDMTAGVVPAKADVLRITFDGEQVVSYKLDGPLVPGFREYRVFMLDLGRRIETRLELFQGEKLIAEEKRSEAEIAMARCSREHPVDAMPRTPDEAEKSPLAQCFEKASSE